MTLCRRNNVYLNQKPGYFTIEHKFGSIIVTCKKKANNIFDKMTLTQ